MLRAALRGDPVRRHRRFRREKEATTGRVEVRWHFCFRSEPMTETLTGLDQTTLELSLKSLKDFSKDYLPPEKLLEWDAKAGFIHENPLPR